MSFLKNMWKNNGKHKKLSEEQNLAKSSPDILLEENLTNSDLINEEDPSVSIEEGGNVQFQKIKYLGSTPVEKETNEKITAEAIRSILRVVKAQGKKLKRVKLHVGLNGIRVTEDGNGENEIMEISIYKISYCSADASNSRVFAFIASNANETIECHAFLCQKRKLAHAVTLTVARAFSMAYEAWRVLPTKHDQIQIHSQLDDRLEKTKDEKTIDKQLIDFDEETKNNVILPRPNGFKQNDWVSFDEENNSTFESQSQSHQRWPSNNVNNNIDLILS